MHIPIAAYVRSNYRRVVPERYRAKIRRYRENIARLPYNAEYGEGYLGPKGWYLSRAKQTSVDGSGPVPWITYPTRMMLERVLSPDMHVFEYGSGNSSLWWAGKVAKVISIEHDQEFAAKLKVEAPSNLTIVHRGFDAPFLDEDGLLASFLEANFDLPKFGAPQWEDYHGLLCREFAAYALEFTKHESRTFDVVVIDGMARVLCCWVVSRLIKQSGIIVFDNADRWHYNPGFRILANAGFRRIDFYGTGPINAYEWCTSIFARDLERFARNVEIPKHQKSDINSLTQGL